MNVARIERYYFPWEYWDAVHKLSSTVRATITEVIFKPMPALIWYNKHRTKERPVGFILDVFTYTSVTSPDNIPLIL